MSAQACTYILASCPRGNLYLGVTTDLVKRVNELRVHPLAGLSRRNDAFRLVWYETHDSMLGAMEKERMLRYWNRLWKLRLVEKMNPEWRDLYEELCN